MSVYLPHSNQMFHQKLITCFSQPVCDMNSLNQIFFSNNRPFFPIMQQLYPNESLEFLKVYGYIARLAINIEMVLPKYFDILKSMENYNKLELTRKQAALLFLLSFFGMMEINNSMRLNKFVVSQVLFAKNGTPFEFARCFLNYLTTIGQWLSQDNAILEEKITFCRISINRNNWNFAQNSFINLCPVNFITLGSLFDGNASYCVDFANKYIGGGTLMGGCVQEEILFATEPEAIVAMLFMEEMGSNDAIGIFNTIQYSNYSGFKNSFAFNGNAINGFISNIKRHRIIAIDADNKDMNLNALDINGYRQIIDRDIYKAFAGFYLVNTENGFEKTIATGNWGCGCFGGIHELKFLEQWIAASFAGVQRLDYYTFNEKQMNNAIKTYEIIRSNFNATGLYCALTNYKWDVNNLILNILQNMNNQYSNRQFS